MLHNGERKFAKKMNGIENCMTDSDLCLCYKSCDNFIVTMKKLPDTTCNESRKGVVDPLHAAFQADKLMVVSIEHKETGLMIWQIKNTIYKACQIWYKISTEVSVPNYDKNPDNIHAPGIHYYLSREAAFYSGYCHIENGPYLSWDNNGQKMEECMYLNGKRHGVCQCWDKYGQKATECTYLNGKLHGHYINWYNGNKDTECTFINDLRHGLYQSWNKYGQKIEECTYTHGKLHGSRLLWFDNGQKRKECTYVNGELHGSLQSWFDNGQPMKECNYAYDNLHGSYIEWFDDGQKRKECTYVDGIMIEPCIEPFNNGSVWVDYDLSMVRSDASI